MSKRIRVAVVYGGRSSEHAISVVSAGSVLAALDPAKYEVVTIGITPSGAWVPTSVDPAQLRIADRQLPSVAEPAGAAVTRFGSDTGSALERRGGGGGILPGLGGTHGGDGHNQGA